MVHRRGEFDVTALVMSVVIVKMWLEPCHPFFPPVVEGILLPPSKVLGLTVSPISGSQLNLAWTANPEPDLGHYNIYRGTTAGFAVNPATDTPFSSTNYKLVTLIPV